MDQVMEQKPELKLFQNDDFGTIRTVVIDGEPWFSGKDIGEALGYENTKDALKKHVFNEDKSVFLKSQFATLEIPNRGMTFVNESGLYSLIFGSKLDSAKEFKRWVTSEVLPSIRKTGKYIAPSENKVEAMLSDMNCNMKIVYAQINNMEEMIGEQNSMLERVVENMTLSTRQQQQMYKAAKDRINHLLNGAHSIEYKKKSKSYFVNLWNSMKSLYNCGSSYKDLNPMYFDEAMEFIKQWEYKEQ